LQEGQIETQTTTICDTNGPWQSHKSLFDFAQGHIQVDLSSFNERTTHRLFEKLMTSNHYTLCAHWCKISLTIQGLKVNQITCSMSLFEATTKSSTL
jgi:hypothetical protein